MVQSDQNPHLSSRRMYLWALAIFPLVLFAELLLTGKVLFWGLPALQFNPWSMAALESLRAGVLPFWNSWNGMGTPLLANYQLALFYPPGWIAYLFGLIGGAPAMAWAHTLLVALHLIWAGLGMAGLLARFETNRLAQTVGGLAFGLCGYLVARSSVFPMVWAAAWLPWIILATSAIAAPDGRGSARPFLPARLIVCIAMQLLAGHAQLAWYSLMLAAAWVLVGGWMARGWRGALQAMLRFGICGLLAAVLVSPQLVPTFEFLARSQRSAEVDYFLGMQYSFWPWRLITFFAPDFFGTPANGSYWGYAAYWEDAAYMGVLPLIFALSTLRQVGRRKRALPDEGGSAYSHVNLVRFLWAVVLISMVLALGKNTPIFPFLYRHIPTFDMFQAPTRYLLLAEFSLALLAGIGVDGWRKPVGARLAWLNRAAAAAFAITLGAGAAALVLRNVEVTFIGASALAGLGALVTALLTLRMPPQELSRPHLGWELLVILFVGCDLLIAGWGLRPAADAALYGDYPANQTLREELNGQRVYLSPADESTVKFERFFRFKDFRPIEDWVNLRAVLPPNLNILDHIGVVGNFDPLVTEGYARWGDFLEQLTPEERLPWLRMMGVGAIESVNANDPGDVDFMPVENAFRWYWTNCARFVSEPDAFFPETARLVEETAGKAEGRLLAVVIYSPPYGKQWCNPSDTGAIELIAENPNRLTLRVTSPTPGWLVVADSYYPGWSVLIDGRQDVLWQANDLFRAVVVPEGQHVVVFTYSPDGYSALLAISTAGWLALMGWDFYAFRRRIQARQT